MTIVKFNILLFLSTLIFDLRLGKWFSLFSHFIQILIGNTNNNNHSNVRKLLMDIFSFINKTSLFDQMKNFENFCNLQAVQILLVKWTVAWPNAYDLSFLIVMKFATWNRNKFILEVHISPIFNMYMKRRKQQFTYHR